MRSAITVAGVVGHASNKTRIAGSTASTGGHEYRGGSSDANARRTAFRETPSFARSL
jgi:hypothetical protein